MLRRGYLYCVSFDKRRPARLENDKANRYPGPTTLEKVAFDVLQASSPDAPRA